MTCLIDDALSSAGVENKEECMSWALGDDWRTLPCHYGVDRWRKRHGDLLTIRDSDDYYSSFYKIGKLFLKSGQATGKTVAAQT